MANMTDTKSIAVRAVAWNCAGWAASKWKWLTDTWQRRKCSLPEILLLCETKTKKLAEMTKVVEPLGYTVHLNVHTGNSSLHGVALLVRTKALKELGIEHDAIKVTLECKTRSDAGKNASDATQGRVVAIRLRFSKSSSMVVVGYYAPNSGVGGKHLEYRAQQWEPALRKALQGLVERETHVVVLGDWNVAPGDMDVTHPDTAHTRACCFKEERQAFATLVSDGWVDAWRKEHGDKSRRIHAP